MTEEKIAYALSAQMNRDAAAARMDNADLGDPDRELARAQVHALLAIGHELGAIRERLDRAVFVRPT